jgi:hypothetical protein
MHAAVCLTENDSIYGTFYKAGWWLDPSTTVGRMGQNTNIVGKYANWETWK